jgi:predicted anti-sigma-YlaC factor YlaD
MTRSQAGDIAVPHTKRRIVRFALLAVALAFIVAGVVQGDFTDTFHKAILICLECIGIG